MEAKSEAQIEQDIQAKGLTAPRVTPEQIDATILKTEYHVFPGSMLTVCCLTLVNGFNVIGESACASPENFDEVIGREIAFKNAREKIWPLEGYLLKQFLHETAQAAADPVEQRLVDQAEVSTKPVPDRP